MRIHNSDYGNIILYFFVFLLVKYAQSDNVAFGNKYDWAQSLPAALAASKVSQKPCMLIIHKTWCSACKNLAPKFAESSEILALSKKFVMVQVIDDDEPTEPQYHPDGGYIPRILFISPSGDVLDQCTNKFGSDKYKYFYSKCEDIVSSMREVLETHSKPLENQIEL